MKFWYCFYCKRDIETIMTFIVFINWKLVSIKKKKYPLENRQFEKSTCALHVHVASEHALTHPLVRMPICDVEGGDEKALSWIMVGKKWPHQSILTLDLSPQMLYGFECAQKLLKSDGWRSVRLWTHIRCLFVINTSYRHSASSLAAELVIDHSVQHSGSALLPTLLSLFLFFSPLLFEWEISFWWIVQQNCFTCNFSLKFTGHVRMILGCWHRHGRW